MTSHFGGNELFRRGTSRLAAKTGGPTLRINTLRIKMPTLSRA